MENGLSWFTKLKDEEEKEEGAWDVIKNKLAEIARLLWVWNVTLCELHSNCYWKIWNHGKADQTPWCEKIFQMDIVTLDKLAETVHGKVWVENNKTI